MCVWIVADHDHKQLTLAAILSVQVHELWTKYLPQIKIS